MTSLDARLDALRGPARPEPHNARTLAALTTNPGCARRALLDAAGVNKDDLAVHLGEARPLAKSSLALTRGVLFEQQVKADGCAELLRLLRDVLDLPLPEVSHTDLSAVGSKSGSMNLRHARTRALLAQAANDKPDVRTLLDHPVLRLSVGQHRVYLEPDVIAFQIDGVFHIIEIKSFAIIDGQADGAKVAGATTQAAAYILALRELFTEEGIPPDRVSDSIILVTPHNFSRRATAAVVDARKQLKSLQRQLTRLERIDVLVDQLPSGTTFDLARDINGIPTRDRHQLQAALHTARARYAPRCRNHCDLAYFCRSEAREAGLVDVLGTSVRDDLGSIDIIGTALDLADGTRDPTPDQVDLASALRHAQTIYTRLEGAA
ncbi:hypothetical protein [Streptomyces sp. NPDC050507]|uniref:hypothetical protein n=1 Tax=Streptomyces sp. NPDC050507 TaxID=3365619 RepID=UPI0037A12EDD